MKKTAALLLALIWLAPLSQPVSAIELELHDNRQETGHIGFVDMQRLFKQFPETIRAKENFEEVVRQAEEQVNIRKVELIHLRNDLAQLRAERKLLGQFQAPVVVSSAPAVAATPAPAPQPVPKPAAPVPAIASQAPVASSAPVAATAISSAPIAAAASAFGATPVPPVAPQLAAAKPAPRPVSALPGFGEASGDMPGESFGWKPSTASAAPSQAAAAKPAGPPAASNKPEPLVINIPGVSTAPITVQPPAQAAPAQPKPAPQVAVSTPAIPSPAPAPVAAAAPAPAPKVDDSAAKQNAAIAEMDAKIALKETELQKKEADFKQYQAESEKNLLDLESRKTEILLGKLHRAIEDVARREGVSVVVDKTSILYGHDAVDLTDKILRYLKNS